MRMAIASGTMMSSFRDQLQQHLASQYLAPKEAKPERPRTLEAYVAKMKLARAQGPIATNTITEHKHHATESIPTGTEMGQPRTRPTRQHPATADRDHTIEPQQATVKRPTPPRPPKAGPNAIAIVAPTPEWEASRKAKKDGKRDFAKENDRKD